MSQSFLESAAEAEILKLGKSGVAKLQGFIGSKMAHETDTTKRYIYAIVMAGIGEYGNVGINTALNAVNDLLNGKTVDSSWMDLEIASNMLAAIQNSSTDERDATRAFLSQVGVVLKDVIAGLVASLA